MAYVLDKHNSFSSCTYYYLNLGGQFAAPYGAIGPRAETLVPAIINKCYPEQKDIDRAEHFGRDVNEIRIKAAYQLVEKFLNKAPGVFNPYENDPHLWPRHAMSQIRDYLDICTAEYREAYFSKDISLDIGSLYEAMSIYQAISAHNPEMLPDYKQSYASDFYTQLKALLGGPEVSAFLNQFLNASQ